MTCWRCSCGATWCDIDFCVYCEGNFVEIEDVGHEIMTGEIGKVVNYKEVKNDE